MSAQGAAEGAAAGAAVAGPWGAAVGGVIGAFGGFGGKSSKPQTPAQTLAPRQITFGGLAVGSGRNTSSTTADQRAALDGAVSGETPTASGLTLSPWLLLAVPAVLLLK